MRYLQDPVESLGCVFGELISRNGTATGWSLAEDRGEKFSDGSVPGSRLKVEFNLFNVEPFKQLFDTATFDATAEGPAAHHPRFEQNFRFGLTACQHRDLSQGSVFVAISRDQKDCFRLSEKVLPRGFGVPLAVEVELIRLVDELKRSRVDGGLRKTQGQFGIGLPEKLLGSSVVVSIDP
jgi:hypothetical protein